MPPLCIPHLSCEATCSDFDEYIASSKETIALERKWVFDCNGQLTDGNGDAITRANFNTRANDIFEADAKKKHEVCDDAGNVK